MLTRSSKRKHKRRTCRVTLRIEHEPGRGWFVSYRNYEGRRCVEQGINASYYRTKGAAIKAWARLLADWPPEGATPSA